jgi:hypothetical protein
MEPEGLLPHSQALTNSLYPETNQSNPCLTILKDPFKYYPPIYAYVFQIAISLRSLQQNPVCICPASHVCCMPHTFHSS